jgi:hypothetical protein
VLNEGKLRNYKDLSPLDFEELVRDLLQADLGISFESFGPGADKGIDLRYAIGAKKIIVQAKRYVDSSFSSLLRELRAERLKVERLKPSRYILAIAQTLSPSQKDKIAEVFAGLPLAIEDIKTLKEIDALLTRHPKIERAHFKLWLSSVNMIERVLYAGIYNRTRAELSEIENLIPKYVGNSGIINADKILRKERILIISGEPGVGKSSLARFLIATHAKQDWKVVVIDSIERAFDATTSDENTLIFFDDFLGQVELTPDFLRGMDAQLPAVFRDIQRRKNLRFILTTRSYILRKAKSIASRIADDEFKPTEFVLKIGHYSRAERAKILYNHLYFSEISKSFRNTLADWKLVVRIVDHENFNPRLIKVLTSPKYVQLETRSARDTILHVLDHPEELWAVPYRQQLNAESRALLIALFFNAPLTKLETLVSTFENFITFFAPTVPPADIKARFRQSLHELEGSFILIGNMLVGFANPGVRDYLKAVVREDRLVKMLLPVAQTFIELQTMWEDHPRQLRSPTLIAEYREQYLAAFERCKGDTSLDILAQIDLCLQMHAEFGGKDFSTMVRRTAEDIPNWTFDDKDIRPVRKLSAAISKSKLSMSARWKANSQLMKAAQIILDDDTSYFTFDEVKDLIGFVRDFDKLPDEVEASAKVFLERWIEESFEDELDSVYDEYDLNEFIKILDEMLIEFNADIPDLSMKIDKRREALLIDDDDENEDSPYIPTSAETDVSITDREIQSMFGALRSKTKKQ